MHWNLVAAAVLILSVVIPNVLAAGPADAEAGISYWLAEQSGERWDATGNFPSYAFSDSDEKIVYWAQFWASRWGGKIKYYEYGYSKDDWSLDLRYKAWKGNDGGFLAVGLGFESERNLGSSDHKYRLLAEGFLPLGKIVSAYGESAYYFGIDDSKWRRDEDNYGYGSRGEWEIEFGVVVRPVRFLNLRAGYRRSVSTEDRRGVANELPFDIRGEYVSSGFIVSASYVF